MSTEARKLENEEERGRRKRELARLRKLRYDDRMRGAAGGAGPRRKGHVIYLTDEAVEVLARNRARNRLLGLPKVLDSRLIEDLLFRSERDSTAFAESGSDDHGQQLPAPTTKLLAEYENQVKLVKELKAQQVAERSAAQRHVNWPLAERELLGAHRLLMPQVGHWLALHLRSALGEATSDWQAMKIVDAEVVDYLGRLVDSVLHHDAG